MTLSYSEVKAVNKTENNTCSLDVMRILYWYNQVQMKNIKNIWNQSQDFGIYRHYQKKPHCELEPMPYN